MRWLAVACLCAGCVPDGPPTTSAPPPPVDSARPRSLGDAPAIVQGRLALGAPGQAPTSFVDVEVDGPGDAALATCNALLDRERERLVGLGPKLAVEIARSCSDDALGPPGAGGPFALMQSDELDSVALVIELGDRAPKSPGALRVRRTSLAGYATEQDCQAALEHLGRASQAANASAEQSKNEWLAAELERQRAREAESCKAGRKTVACARAREVTELLEQKVAEPSAPAPPPSSGAAACFRR